MIFEKKKNAWKYLVILLVLAIGTFLFLRFTLRYKSFEGKIESLRIEEYRIYEHGVYLPSFTEAPYYVKRATVRTGKGEILDIAIYPGDLGQEYEGAFIKGEYRPGNTVEINSKKGVFDFLNPSGPKIELKGNPDGVVKRYKLKK